MMMNKLVVARKLLAVFFVGVPLAGAWAGAHDSAEKVDHSAHDQHAGHDMSGHDMAGHSTERDAEGRRLFGMKHNVTPEIADQLRERIRGWENISDEEIAMSMTMMGSNYTWYISEDEMDAKTGVLILLHGFRERGDRVFTERLQPYAEIFPTALAFGMSMMMSDHIQLAVNGSI